MSLLPTAVLPLVIGAAIDQGIAARRPDVLLGWVAVVLGLAVLVSLASAVLRWTSHTLWIHGATSAQRALIAQTVALGATLPKRVRTGDVVAMGSEDVYDVGNGIELFGRAIGAVVAFGVIATALVTISPLLGVVTLVGVPLAVVGIGPLLRPLRERKEAQRELFSEVNALGADIVSGLRILRGIGGERQFLDRFIGASGRVREAGLRVGKVQSWLDVAQIALPGAVTVVVTWLGARLALEGTISAGELVALYGASAFLVVPVSAATEAAEAASTALVAVGKIDALLRVAPEFAGAPAGTPVQGTAVQGTPAAGTPVQGAPVQGAPVQGAPVQGAPVQGTPVQGAPVQGTNVAGTNVALVQPGRTNATLVQPPPAAPPPAAPPPAAPPPAAPPPAALPPGALPLDAGALHIPAGQLTVLAPDRALAERLAGFAPGDVLVGGVPLHLVDPAELRARVVLVLGDDLWFSGRLGTELAVGDRVPVERAVYAADAADVVDGLPARYDEVLGECGRSVSGGQRQRLQLARALTLDPDVLLLEEPTSAVDAHTEARIARRMADLRAGRTTVVFTNSPLWRAVVSDHGCPCNNFHAREEGAR